MKKAWIFAALLCCAPAIKASMISTLGAWDGSSSISAWGSVSSGSTPTYGQTFTADASNNVLNAMTFEINDNSTSVPYQAYVYSWTGTAITGPALFTSPLLTINAAVGFQAVKVDTGAVALTPGNVYIAFFSTIGDDGTAGGFSWGGNLPDTTYPGGKFEYNNSGTFAGLATPSPAWNNFGDFGDLAFQLDFNAPEPSTFIMLLGGLALAWGARRKCQNS